MHISFDSLKSFFSDHSSKTQDVILQKKWEGLGLPKEWYEKDPEAARFLFKTRLIYPIVGFEASTQEKRYHQGLRFEAGKLQMLVEGKFQGITDQVLHRFKWVTACKWLPSEGAKIVEIGHEDKKSWTYLGEKGLIPLDRWKWDEFTPVTRLGLIEHAHLIQHASQGKKTSGCVLQVVTYPRDIFRANRWTQNLHLHQPVHAAIRLIDEMGYVYSTGFGVPEEEMRYRNGYFNCLSAVNGTPTILDYEEFRQHEGRLTTSLWISHNQCEKLFRKIQRWHAHGIRFQFMQQNCNTFAVQLLKEIGIHVNISSNVNAWLAKMMPQPMQRFAEAIKTSKVVTVLSKLFFLVGIVIAWVSRYLKNAILNVILAVLGANRGSPLKTGSIEHEFPQFRRLRFSLFSDETQKIDSPSKTMEWQLKQPTTWVHAYRGPSMTLVPPQDSKQIKEDEALKHKLQELYEVSPRSHLKG